MPKRSRPWEGKWDDAGRSRKRSRRRGPSRPYALQKHRRTAVPRLRSVMFPGARRGGVPDQLWTTLRYVANPELTPAGLSVGNIFRVNSVYDPDQTGIGGQPRYYDQLSAMYNRYTVTSARVVCRASTQSGAACDLLITATNDSIPAVTDFGGAFEQPFRSNMLRMAPVTSGRTTGTISKTFSMAALRGLPTRQILADDNFSALTTTNPATQSYIGVLASSPSTSATNVNVWVEISYRVRFFDRKIIGAS